MRGGARAAAISPPPSPTLEQRDVARWLSLGGRIDSLSTDHADVWNVRGGSGPLCEPPIPMADRIEVVAQVFASWRRFLGAEASLGFIESLGFWDIEGPDGKSYKNTEPAVFSKIDGWIPRLEDVTSRLLDAAKRHNPVPGTPLLDHYLIDYGLEGVEYDTHTYGPSPTGGLNYGRVLGAEAIMHRHGLRTGVMMNAFADRSLNCSAAFARCSASAALRTLEYTQGYMRLPSRLSEHAVLEQWQPHPNTTGPASLPYSGMWREILENQQEITTLTVIWARQLVVKACHSALSRSWGRSRLLPCGWRALVQQL